MWLSTMMNVGRSVVFWNFLNARCERRRSLASVDVLDVPAVGLEAGADVFGEGQRRVAFDGDVVVVVDPAEVRQLEVPGQEAASLEMPSIMSPSPHRT